MLTLFEKKKKRNFLLKFEPTFRFGDKVQLRLGKGSCTFPGRGTTVKAALNSVCKTKVFFCCTSSGVHLGQNLQKMSLKISQSCYKVVVQYLPYLDFEISTITEYSNSKFAICILNTLESIQPYWIVPRKFLREFYKIVLDQRAKYVAYCSNMKKISWNQFHF